MMRSDSGAEPVSGVVRDKIKLKYALVLKEDFYSLAFYGFYLDSDEEELSSHKDMHKVKEMINQ